MSHLVFPSSAAPPTSPKLTAVRSLTGPGTSAGTLLPRRKSPRVIRHGADGPGVARRPAPSDDGRPGPHARGLGTVGQAQGRCHGAGLGTAGGALGDRGQGPRAPARLLRRAVQLEDRGRLHHGDPRRRRRPRARARGPPPWQRAFRGDPLRPGGRPAGVRSTNRSPSVPPSWPNPSTSPAGRRLAGSPIPRATP